MGLKVLKDSRNDSLRIKELINLSPVLFPEDSNTFAISFTHTAPKHPSNLSLVSINHTIRIINLR